jgi:hypothetical protein
MQEPEQERREALLRRSRQGDRARTALEELEGFLTGKKEEILSRLRKAKNPNEAFELAVEYRTVMNFEGSAKTAVAVGDAAEKQIMESGE